MISRKTFSKYIMWLAIITLAICQFVQVYPIIVWSSETYMGVFVSLMGIAVAVIIGYQAISANELKNDLKEKSQDYEKLRREFSTYKSDVNTTISKIENIVNSDIATVDSKTAALQKHTDLILVSCQESIAILNALIIENTKNLIQRHPLDSFAKMHEALYFSLGYDSDNTEFIFSKLRQYGSEIQTQTFGSFSITREGLFYCNAPFAGRSLKDVIESVFLPPIKEVETKITNHDRFSSISHDYKILMKQFYERLSVCATRMYPKDGSEMHEKFR